MPERFKIVLADDATENVGLLLRLRLPWLFGGMLVGGITIFAISRFADILATDVRLAFFMPIIVYLSGAVATQTQEIYVRNLTRGHARFGVYFFKELSLGIILGLFLGAVVGMAALLWLGSRSLAVTVGLALVANIIVGSMIGLIIPNVLKAEHLDPAVGAGPVTTVLLDLIGILIYFSIAGLFLR